MQPLLPMLASTTFLTESDVSTKAICVALLTLVYLLGSIILIDACDTNQDPKDK
jgi:hypothetical protein